MRLPACQTATIAKRLTLQLRSSYKVHENDAQAHLLPHNTLVEPYVRDASAGPVALVLAPTRELASQIEEEAVKFGKCVEVRSERLTR